MTLTSLDLFRSKYIASNIQIFWVVALQNMTGDQATQSLVGCDNIINCIETVTVWQND